MHDDRSIAGELLRGYAKRKKTLHAPGPRAYTLTYSFRVFGQFLFIVRVGNALNGRQRLSAISLLNPNVYDALLIFVVSGRLANFVGKRV